MDHKVLKDESKIIDAIPAGDYVVVLDERGQLATSHQAANILKMIEDRGEHVTVILGGAKGLSAETKNTAKLRLSLSPMTTTHDLAHIFFLEQLYRVFTIIKGKEYHY